MERNLLRDFIYHLDTDGEMKLGHAPKEVEEWLEQLNLPLDLLRFLQWDWPQTSCQIGHITMMSSQEIYEEELNESLVKHKLLQIGSAPNGDSLVIDFHSEECPIVFLSHEEYWENEEKPREILQQIAPEMDSFLYRIIEGKYIPTDYFAAYDFNEFLDKEKNRANR